MPAKPIAVVCVAESAKLRNHNAACSPTDGTKLLNSSASNSARTGAKIGKADSEPSPITASGTSETSVV